MCLPSLVLRYPTQAGSTHVSCSADVPYELTPEFLAELFTKHRIDYVVHGDDPCLLPDGTDAYAHAKQMGRFKMVSCSPATHTLSVSLSQNLLRKSLL